MEVDYNILVQNHVHYIMFKNIILWVGGAMVKDLILQCEGEKLMSPHLQPRLPWLLK